MARPKPVFSQEEISANPRGTPLVKFDRKTGRTITLLSLRNGDVFLTIEGPGVPEVNITPGKMEIECRTWNLNILARVLLDAKYDARLRR